MPRVKSSYHHGALREALIAEGRRLLLEQGPAAVTFRELARRTGVSHAAPGQHFAGRDGLLASIAATGFEELSDALRAAALEDDRRRRLSVYAHRHVQFAVENGPLMALMFAARTGDAGAPAREAADRFFALGAELLGAGVEPGGSSSPYLVAATLEGIGALVVAGRLPEDRLDEVVDDAVEMMLPVLSLGPG
jgi:AcrR family transcriptional regulator